MSPAHVNVPPKSGVVSKSVVARRPVGLSKAAAAIARMARTPLAQRMLQDMQLVGFGERTQETYLRTVFKLAEHYRIAPDQLREEQVRAYFLVLRNDKQFAPGSLKVAYCGVRFFYTHTVPRDWVTLKQLRVPKQRKLPAVLSVTEVRQLIDAIRTPHNRAFCVATGDTGARSGVRLDQPPAAEAQTGRHLRPMRRTVDPADDHLARSPHHRPASPAAASRQQLNTRTRTPVTRRGMTSAPHHRAVSQRHRALLEIAAARSGSPCAPQAIVGVNGPDFAGSASVPSGPRPASTRHSCEQLITEPPARLTAPAPSIG